MLQRPAFAKRIFFNPFNIGELDFLKVHATSECSIGQGLKVTGKNDLVETVTFKDTSSQLGYGIWQGRRLQIVTTGERTAFYSGKKVSLSLFLEIPADAVVHQGLDALSRVKVFVKFVEHRYDMTGSEVQLYKVLIGTFIAGVVFYRVAVKKILLIL